MGAGQGGARHNDHQLRLDPVGSLTIGELEPVCHPIDVGINSNGRFNIQLIEHHAGGLAANTGQGFERDPVGRHLPPMLIDQDLGQGDDVFGLVAIKADGPDVTLYPFKAEGQHVGGIVSPFEQGLNGPIDPLIRGLSRQDHSDQKRIGVGKMQLGARMLIGRFKARKKGLDPGAFLRR